MQTAIKFPFLALLALALMLPASSCVTKKKYKSMQSTLQTELDLANQNLAKYGKQLNELMSQLSVCEAEKAANKNEAQTALRLREEQIAD